MNDPQADQKPRSDAVSGVLDRALDLVGFLRARCRWDAAQTHHSLRRYLLEESHEVVDAIDAHDDESLQDELGDLLLNLAFQVVIAEERAAFDRESVVHGLEEKMKRRHPHLYGGAPEEWDAIKARERGDETGEDGSILAGVAGDADPLSHAHSVQARVAEFGFDWAEADGAWQKVLEEIEEVDGERRSGNPVRLEEEMGDLLFSMVNFARLAGVHPGTALRRANAKFTRRFSALERMAGEQGIVIGEASLEALDELWNAVKGEEA